MMRLVTPRQALQEIRKTPDGSPWWAKKLYKDIVEHLTNAEFRGSPLIDTPMSELACHAVLQEAVDVVRKPASTEQLMRDFHKQLERGRVQ